MIKILLTSAGYQGGATLIRKLKELDNRFYFIGADINRKSAAKFYCDKFYRVSPAIKYEMKSEKFIREISEIIKKEKIDIVLPAGSYDCYGLSLLKETLVNKKSKTEIMVASERTIFNCNNKYHTYWEVRNVVKNLPRFLYWHKGYCIKPLTGKGSRKINFIEMYK